MGVVRTNLTLIRQGEVVEGGTKNHRHRRLVLSSTTVEQLRLHERSLDEERRHSVTRGPAN